MGVSASWIIGTAGGNEQDTPQPSHNKTNISLGAEDRTPSTKTSDLLDREAAGPTNPTTPKDLHLPEDSRLRRASAAELSKGKRTAEMVRNGFLPMLADAEAQDDGSPSAYWRFLDIALKLEERSQSVEALSMGHGYFMIKKSRDDEATNPTLFGNQPYVVYGPFNEGNLYVPMTNPGKVLEMHRALNQLRMSIIRSFADMHNNMSLHDRKIVYNSWKESGKITGLSDEIYMASQHNFQWRDEDAWLTIKAFPGEE